MNRRISWLSAALAVAVLPFSTEVNAQDVPRMEWELLEAHDVEFMAIIARMEDDGYLLDYSRAQQRDVAAVFVLAAAPAVAERTANRPRYEREEPAGVLVTAFLPDRSTSLRVLERIVLYARRQGDALLFWGHARDSDGTIAVAVSGTLRDGQIDLTISDAAWDRFFTLFTEQPRSAIRDQIYYEQVEAWSCAPFDIVCRLPAFISANYRARLVDNRWGI